MMSQNMFLWINKKNIRVPILSRVITVPVLLQNAGYGKCPKILNTLFHSFLAYFLSFMQLFLKILKWNDKQCRPRSDCS